ncbi:MAG: hypothetical protein M1824_001718 [Vezdaea acicularis]|nr:MAG: hypothetical protein M1824_001718 [Vezdaea acicularis]
MAEEPRLPKRHTPSAPKQTLMADRLRKANAAAVGSISERAGAHGKLPAGYAGTARKITYVIVALPIAIVTSWVLYDRLVLGTERKVLVRPPPDTAASKENE